MNIVNELDKDGFVYLVWAEGTPRYKIGMSIDPHQRVQQLNEQSCYPLVLLAKQYFECVATHEKRLHRLLYEYRVHGEWFELPEWVVRHIDSWFHDSKCRKITINKTSKVLIYQQGSLEPEVWSKKKFLRSKIPYPFNIPSTKKDIERAIILLWEVSRGTRLTAKVRKELFVLIGCKPNEGDAAAWRELLKKHLKETQDFCDANVSEEPVVNLSDFKAAI